MTDDDCQCDIDQHHILCAWCKQRLARENAAVGSVATIVLTPTQLTWLTRMHREGIVTRPYPDNFRSFDKVMAILETAKLVVPYVHGGYELTAFGRGIACDMVTYTRDPTRPRHP